MNRFLYPVWMFFKWSMVVTGTVAAVVMLWAFLRPKPVDWRMVLSSQEGCQFAFASAQGKWAPDSVAGTGSLIRKNGGTTPVVFLSATRFWSSLEENGGWSIPVQRKCTIERRGTVTTAAGKPAPIFLASHCQKGDYYADYGTESLLYGYVSQGRESDFMWLASDDKSALLKHEDELKTIVKSHSTTLPKCIALGKPKS